MLGFALEGSAKSINTYGLNIGAGQTREFYIYMNTTRNNLVSFQIDLKCPRASPSTWIDAAYPLV